MRLQTQLAPLLLSLFLAGCSSSIESSKSFEGAVKAITLDTKSVPENLTVLLNDEPQSTKTNKGEIKLSVPEGQAHGVKVKDEKPFGTITYQAEIPQESKDPVSLKIEPKENEELNQQVSVFLKDYFTAVNRKKNALSYLSTDSIFDPEDVYNHTFQSAVLYTSSFKPLMIDDKPGLILLVDAEGQGTSSSTLTFQFRLLWEDGKWKIFYQRVLYEVFEGNLLFEYEKDSYPGKQYPGPHDILLSL